MMYITTISFLQLKRKKSEIFPPPLLLESRCNKLLLAELVSIKTPTNLPEGDSFISGVLQISSRQIRIWTGFATSCIWIRIP